MEPKNDILWRVFNVAQVNPQKVAITLDDQTVTYAELIQEIDRVACILRKFQFSPGEIIYQLIERSFEMVFGSLGIMRAGYVYCPLSLADPPERIGSLIAQLGRQCILLHKKTLNRLQTGTIQHTILLDDLSCRLLAIGDMPDISFHTKHDPALITFTTGTTGHYKMVLHTHGSISSGLISYLNWSIKMYSFQNQVLQVAASSWILHLIEILSGLASGGSLILLRPGGQFDMDYFSQTIISQQIMTMTVGPAIIRALTTYLEMSQRLDVFKFVRYLAVAGEGVKPLQWMRFLKFLNGSDTQIISNYGSTETLAVMGCQLIDIPGSGTPIGWLLPDVKLLLMDEEGQTISQGSSMDESGQICVGGSSLLQCYFNNQKATKNAFIFIDNNAYFKTGDLAYYNITGEVILIGRIDFQIKIRGQRLKTTDIENTIMNWSPNDISNCLVTKLPQSEDLLVAYVISNNSELPIEEIRNHCRKHLRQYMIPTSFVVMDKFPLNVNGKIDRTKLPLPSLLLNPSPNLSNIEYQVRSELEEKIHCLWCSKLMLDAIPNNKNCLEIGGSSLFLMDVFNYYQYNFAPDKHLNIADYFINPTIEQHAHLLVNSKSKEGTVWAPLHLQHGIASFAQERIWLDEKVRFVESIHQGVSVYNELLVFKLTTPAPFSIRWFSQAINSMVAKNAILRTALIYDQDTLFQKVLPISSNSFDLQITNVATEDELKEIFHNEETNRSFFNLEKGQVFRCHILRWLCDNEDEDYLKSNDIIIFNIHHAAIDGSSVVVFINELQRALKKEDSINNDEDSITYLDYAQYERIKEWSRARDHWRYVLSTVRIPTIQQDSFIRTGKGYVKHIELDQEVVLKLNRLTSCSGLTIFQVGLATFFSFLFKMSNNEQLDVCTGIVVANRYEYQLQNMIGFFANTLPFFVKINPYESFLQLCRRVQQIWFDMLPCTTLPYQEMIRINPKFGPAFIRTCFFLETTINNSEKNIELDNGITFKSMNTNSISGSTSKFDLCCTLYENRQDSTISISLNASSDIYDEIAVSTMACQLKGVFNQILSASCIHELSLLLPNDVKLIDELNNTSFGHHSIACAHWELAHRMELHPQKLAVVLENGSLSYGELLYSAYQLADYLIDKCAVQPDQIICQMTERSFEAVIGMISIWMSGCRYVSLSLYEPDSIIREKIEHINPQYILVHKSTHDHISYGCTLIDIDQVFRLNQTYRSPLNMTHIQAVDTTPEHISHIIFISDISGLFKAIQFSHRSFISCMNSNMIQQEDVVLHHTSPTFKSHLLETSGTLIKGGQVVLLHPNGSLNMDCFSTTIMRHQVSYLNIAPSLRSMLFEYLCAAPEKTNFKTLRCISFENEFLTIDEMHKMYNFINEHCCINNYYGCSEYAEALMHYVSVRNNDGSTFRPLEQPIINARIYLLDECLQPVVPGVQISELVIGGPGLFHNYYGHDCRMDRALCVINDETCYKTGDLVSFNTTSRQFELRGKCSRQIHSRKHSIDLKRIAFVLMEMVENCFVTQAKYDNVDYIIAYVQTTCTIEDLRKRCLDHLPLYMVPSLFMILNIMPLHPSGQVNEQELPVPDFSCIPRTSNAIEWPRSEIEQRVHKIWCQALPDVNSISSIFEPFFSFGDDPISFIRLFYLYGINFKHNVSVADFLQQPTIYQHARLLAETSRLQKTQIQIQSITNIEAPASYAQSRIWLDEWTRFHPDQRNIAIYNMPFLYHLRPGSCLSIEKLKRAIHLTISKHQSLRTALLLDKKTNKIVQRIIDPYGMKRSLFSFVESVIETDKQLEEILYCEKRDPRILNLTEGIVLRCHVVYYKQISSTKLLCNKDAIIFNFHHALFDYPSMNIFLHDLNEAYATDQLLTSNKMALSYVDYSIIEHQTPMNIAKAFWSSMLHDYRLDHSLPLPFDRHRLSNEYRSGRGISYTFDFDESFSRDFFKYSSSIGVTVHQLVLATYYAFLFKLTDGETDLCIGTNTDGRYAKELTSVIGMFVNAIPLRCQLDPYWSFHRLVNYVQKMVTDCFKYSYLPLQHIMAQQSHATRPSFLETSFECLPYAANNMNDEIKIGDAQLKALPISIKINEDEIMAKFDFSLVVEYNVNIDQISWTIDATLDLFDRTTVAKTVHYFQLILEHLFYANCSQRMSEQLFELPLQMPDERILMKSINNTERLLPSSTCIHQEFAKQASQYSQKIAVELDQQSLTYSELLYYAQMLSLHLRNEQNITRGDVVCQCVERSLSMVIGIIAIEMRGAIYCPLSSRDPQHRLHSLIEQTQTSVVLVHHMTRTKFKESVILLDISLLLTFHNMPQDIHCSQLSNIIVTPEDIAYVTFTSGSTGIPKGALIKQRNFIASMNALTSVKLFTDNDVMLQMASCSYDVHIQEIVGGLIVGATIVMLVPQGNMDLKYVMKTLKEKQISYIQIVPSYLNSLLDLLQQENPTDYQTLQNIDIGGDMCTSKLFQKLQQFLPAHTSIWNLYGPAESTIDSTFHLFNAITNSVSIPIGLPLYHYHCLVLDDFLQGTVLRQEGILYIGGEGVFMGYLRRNDLTAKALITIDDQTFYKTGDLVIANNNGLLEFKRRKDYQIKLHGQRIELEEIEQCLLLTSISGCVVTKWDDDHLVAYVQPSNVDEDQLRDHCRSHLPSHMIPSMFVALDSLPLNANGKIDRKSLPSPRLSNSTPLTDNESNDCLDSLEELVRNSWCEVLHCDKKQISKIANFFNIGGHSLLLIELFFRYETLFDLDVNTISITSFLEQPTVYQHATLLKNAKNRYAKSANWYPLHIIKGMASFAQERIFLDEHVRFSENFAIYNEPIILQLTDGLLSVDRLLHALRCVLNKHAVLRTSLIFDSESDTVQQHITDNHTEFKIIDKQTFENEAQSNEIIYNITIDPNLFDLSSGRVFHCQILRHVDSTNKIYSAKHLMKSDILVLVFHHAVYDRSSWQTFFNDVLMAYSSDEPILFMDESLQYIDYAVYEHQLDMEPSRNFWHSQFKQHHLRSRIQLPADRQRSVSEQRSPKASSVEVCFDDDVSSACLNYASSQQVTLYQLGLATFYAFLFKITHGEDDLTVGCLNANRYRSELQNIVGMFVSMLPHHIQLNPEQSFEKLVAHVQRKCFSILEHSHYSLQKILADFHLNQSNVPFLETVFEFITVSSTTNQYSFDTATLQCDVTHQSCIVAKFDFLLLFFCTPTSTDKKLSFQFICSNDMFSEATIGELARRFKILVDQLFSFNSNDHQKNNCHAPIREANIFLPEEVEEMQSFHFRRQPNASNEGPASYAQTRIYLNKRILNSLNEQHLATHNTPFIFRLLPNNTLCVTKIYQALKQIILKHQILRTSLIFDEQSKQLIQRLSDHNKSNGKLFTCCETYFETDEELETIINNELWNCQHFDLTQGLGFRCHIIYFKENCLNDLLSDKDVIIFNFHHAVFDNISMNIFLRDLNEAYSSGSLTINEENDLRYLDYAISEHQMPMSVANMFWLDYLYNCRLDQLISLPYDRYPLTDENRTVRTVSCSFEFDQSISQQLLTYATLNNMKIQHVLLAVYYNFLFKLTNGDADICIAMAVDNRYRNELKTLIGQFENFIPIRHQINAHDSFDQMVDNVSRMVTNSLTYSYFPLHRILTQLSNRLKTTHLNIFFGFEIGSNELVTNYSQLHATCTQAKNTEHQIMSEFDFALTFQHDVNTSQLSCGINVSLDLFNINTINRVAQQFYAIFYQLFECNIQNLSQHPIPELSLMLPNEKYQTQSINNTRSPYFSVNCVPYEFALQANDYSQKLAVELDDQCLTYSELLHYSQLLCFNLLNSYDFGPNEIVCQCVERSISMVIGMMAIEMAGAIYCPLSPHDPKHRLSQLIEQIQCRLVLVHVHTRKKFSNNSILFDMDIFFKTSNIQSKIHVDIFSNVSTTLDTIAYIIFTSGSTGTPKAAQVRHKNISECVHSLNFIDSFNKYDRVLQMARCSFDIHVQEILGTLMIAGTLVMLHPGGTVDFDYLSKTLETKQITYLHTVPSLLHSFFSFIISSGSWNVVKYLRTICSIGEPFLLKLVDLIPKIRSLNCKVWNLYGPAEATIAATYHLVNTSNDRDNVPIGVPLPNYRCLILDEFLQSTITYQDGELYIGGVGVFAGYFERQNLTAKALIVVDGEVFYRTGDTARTDKNALILYQGRKDHQIKLRGQRIEPGEIERCLSNRSITACVVVKWGADYLVAYIESSSQIDKKQLLQYCQSRLPSYMVPYHFVVLDEIPRNPNGKIDRKRLPTPEFLSDSVENDYSSNEEPHNELQTFIHSLWCKILRRNRVPINANFFSVGGHSLLLVQLYHNYRMSITTKMNSFDIAELYKYPTIADHALLIHKSINQQEESETNTCTTNGIQGQDYSQEIGIRSNIVDHVIIETDKLSRYQPFPVTLIQHAYLIGRDGLLDLGRVSCFSYEEYDFASNLDINRLEQALNYLIQRHEALRIVFPSHNEQRILEITPYYTIPIVNLDDSMPVDEQLISRRENLSHKILPANHWPLFDVQVTCFTIANELHMRLHIGFDALLMDFWSSILFTNELNHLYFNPNATFTTLNISYRDYVMAQQQLKSTIHYEMDKQYWTNRLSSFPLGPSLPLQCLPNEIKMQRHSSLYEKLDESLWKKLKERITMQRITPAGFFASLYATVLSKWSENKHFALNLPVFNRLPIHPQVNDIIGDFTTIVPLEINLSRPTVFHRFVETTQKQLWNDLEHMTYDGVSFIRDMTQFHQTREIVLPFVLTCGIDGADVYQTSDRFNTFLDKTPVYAISQTPQVHLDNIIFESNGSLLVSWIYVEKLFPNKMINEMYDMFLDLLKKLAISDDIWRESILHLLPNEQQERRQIFNQTLWKPKLRHNLLHLLVIEQAEKTPDAWAILSPRKNLTYKQLMKYVYSLAYRLQEQGTHTNQVIAVLMRKGWEQVVACLAVLCSGAAYLPLDSDSPHDRLRELVEETNVKIILSQSDWSHVFTHITTILVDQFEHDNYPQSYSPKEQLPTDLAYIIYTSGSTGKPKGVMINHMAVLNTIVDINSRLEISPNDKLFALSQLTFDLSVYDIFSMLIAGGSIVIPNYEDYKNPKIWYDMMIEHHVTIWNSVPTLMQMLVEHLGQSYRENQLRHVLLSGDWIPLSLPEWIYNTFGEQMTITSLGGATEASIWSIAFTLPKTIPNYWKSIPYGMPLRNQHYYVYDVHLNDCPEWVVGELYIGGIGISDGYWNDQEKTKASFIIQPDTYERLYRTGDYGRFLPAGYIEFMGRKDFQVKIHGHRIELGEIEHHLQRHKDIHQAIVIVEQKSQQMVAYVVPETRSPPFHHTEHSQNLIESSIERTKFKLARSSMRRHYESSENIILIKPQRTESLVDKYYARKSYRQFTGEIIEKSAIEYLLEKCFALSHKANMCNLSFDSNTISQLFSILTPIQVTNQPLPKYRYASAGSLYPVEVYVEFCTSCDKICPGLYYYNPEQHSLELVNKTACQNDMSIRVHLIGRSSVIAPLYGTLLGHQFCALETGYIIGLLQQEASNLGLTCSSAVLGNSMEYQSIELEKHDTHYQVEISAGGNHMTNNLYTENFQCIIYFNRAEKGNCQWYTFERGSLTLIPVEIDIEHKTVNDEIPLFFDNEDDTKVIFYDCQCVIFFIGKYDDQLRIGTISHLLMDLGHTMNIGTCPIGSCSNLPKQVNNILEKFLHSTKSSGDVALLHTLFIGKISNEQKHDRASSTIRKRPTAAEALKTYLRSMLPIYMIPAHFVTISEVPLSSNGKVDRKVLGEMFCTRSDEDGYVAPSNELEKTIANIWREILYNKELKSPNNEFKPSTLSSAFSEDDASRRDLIPNNCDPDTMESFSISSTANFYDLGGDSLLLVRLYRHYQSLFDFDSEMLGIGRFFEENTVSAHASLIENVMLHKKKPSQWEELHFRRGSFDLLENTINDPVSSLLNVSFFIRRGNMADLPECIAMNTEELEELEKVYHSEVIQEIHFMCIDDRWLNENLQSRKRLVAIIISQTYTENMLLNELDKTFVSKHLDGFQMPWAVLIDKEFSGCDNKSSYSSPDKVNQRTVEIQYLCKIMNILQDYISNTNKNIIDFSNTTQQQIITQSDLLIETDKILHPSIQPHTSIINISHRKDIFLTGCTGFLGSHLLSELLIQTDGNIYCLVRSKTSIKLTHARVFYLFGDLTLPQLGLGNDQYSMLAAKIRSIYHCGASVSFIRPYTGLRSTNVLGTIELIKLACSINCRINYISTSRVLDTKDEDGYVQSKRVAECLLEQAIQRGLCVSIFRPGYISWSLLSGKFNKNDWLTHLLLDLLQFGSAPDTNETLDITPVDQMNKYLVELGESERTVKVTVNMPAAYKVPFKSLWKEICRAKNINPHYLNITDWQEKLNSQLRVEPLSFLGLQFFSKMLEDQSSSTTLSTDITETDLNLSIFVQELLRP